jgi:hypothetical protein
MGSLKYTICNGCISEGCLPVQTTTLDFFRVDPPGQSGNWSLADTNRLLSLVADHGDNWPEIANLLKSHTAAECLLHFLRLPMYDQYYIADPLAVPAGSLPEEPKLLPFMVAPDPIAAYVEFINAVDRRLGSVVAENAQKQIQAILSEKSGVMLFNQVHPILASLLRLTGETAGPLSRGDCGEMIATLRDLLRRLDQEVSAQFREFEHEVKELHQHSNRDSASADHEEVF